jgi:ferredoxin
MAKEASTGAVSVDKTKCDPTACVTGTGQYPCVTGCQRGGYPKVGKAYEDAPTTLEMNKCTLCFGRAGVDDPTKKNMLPTTARMDASGFISEIAGTTGARVPELAHMPACVSTCPAKAMKWDTRDNILAYLNDSANGFIFGAGSVAPGTKNWVGTGSVYWASRKVLLAPPKADPFIEDHVLPMTSSMLPKMLVPTLVVGGLAALSARRSRVETSATTGGEVQG